MLPTQTAHDQDHGNPDPFGGNTDPWWRDGADRALAVLASTGREFTLDELRADPFNLPEPHHPNAWGSLARSAHCAGLIEPVGFQASTLPTRNGSVIRTWRGTRGGESR